MIAFAYRMSGPPVQQVTQMESFDMLKTQNELFFSYVGPRNGSLWNNYYTIAEHFQPHAYFYTTNRDIASQHFHINSVPVVLVYKENNHYHFPSKLLPYRYFFFFVHIHYPGLIATIFTIFPLTFQCLVTIKKLKNHF